MKGSVLYMFCENLLFSVFSNYSCTLYVICCHSGICLVIKCFYVQRNDSPFLTHSTRTVSLLWNGLSTCALQMDTHRPPPLLPSTFLLILINDEGGKRIIYIFSCFSFVHSSQLLKDFQKFTFCRCVSQHIFLMIFFSKRWTASVSFLLVPTLCTPINGPQHNEGLISSCCTICPLTVRKDCSQ